MLQILHNFAKFQKLQLDNLVDFEKCCKTRIYLQKSVPIQPKTSNILPTFCQKLATTLRVVASRFPPLRTGRAAEPVSFSGAIAGSSSRKGRAVGFAPYSGCMVHGRKKERGHFNTVVSKSMSYLYTTLKNREFPSDSGYEICITSISPLPFCKIVLRFATTLSIGL